MAWGLKNIWSETIIFFSSESFITTPMAWVRKGETFLNREKKEEKSINESQLSSSFCNDETTKMDFILKWNAWNV